MKYACGHLLDKEREEFNTRPIIDTLERESSLIKSHKIIITKKQKSFEHVNKEHRFTKISKLYINFYGFLEDIFSDWTSIQICPIILTR